MTVRTGAARQVDACGERAPEVLRKEAAAAFEALSRAYAAQFGTPMCVADAYRDYDQQVAMKAERGDYAATPGTSQHGWARAVDLCGGVDTDGTAQNAWMRWNAPQFGWYHPSWADPGRAARTSRGTGSTPADPAGWAERHEQSSAPAVSPRAVVNGHSVTVGWTLDDRSQLM